MIVAAAISRNGTIWTLPAPARHCHLLWVMHKVLCWNPVRNGYDRWSAEDERRMVQGFVDESGAFLDRVQAMDHAVACGQEGRHRADLQSQRELFSEDLW